MAEESHAKDLRKSVYYPEVCSKDQRILLHVAGPLYYLRDPKMCVDVVMKLGSRHKRTVTDAFVF